MSRFCKGKAVRFFLFLILFAAIAQLAAPVSHVEKDNPFKKLGVQVFIKRPKAPDFTVRRIDGTEVRLSNLKGKVVFINFFATWCTPCRYEMPEMEALYKTFKDKNLEILAISIDTTSAPVKPFADSLKLTFPIAHDPGMKVARQFGFRGPPLSYFIDRTGHVAGGAAGPRKWNSPLAHQIVEKLLSETSS